MTACIGDGGIIVLSALLGSTWALSLLTYLRVRRK